MTETGGLKQNAEARFRRRAGLAWRVCLFLFAALAGALAWRVLLEPAWAAVSQRQDLAAELSLFGETALREAIIASPAILLAFAAWEGVAVLRRLALGRGAARAARMFAHLGAAVLLAGLMQLVGAPSLLAMLAEGGWALRVDFDLVGAGLFVLGAAIRMAAHALAEGG